MSAVGRRSLLLLPLVVGLPARAADERPLSPLERAARQRQPTASGGEPQVLQVGPTRALKTPSAAARQAKSGDTVEIDAGDYPGDVAQWPQDRLTLKGVGGRAVLQAEGRAADRKAIWVIGGRDVRVEAVEFAECRVADRNGAGIRAEGGNLTVVDCRFRDNENGILSTGNPAAEIVIERSEFARNGYRDGRAHGLYIGAVKSLRLTGCYLHGTPAGHLVKSRALSNLIAYNRIMDESDGSASYAIDLSNGGVGLILGNLIQQGRKAENEHLIAFGAEGSDRPENRLIVVNNTLVNELGNGTFVRLSLGRAQLVDNLFVGAGEVLEGEGRARNNLLAALAGQAPSLAAGRGESNRTVASAGLRDIARYDYRLAPDSPAIGAGTDPAAATGEPAAVPAFEYQHPLQLKPRRAGPPFDIGGHAASR